MQDGVLVLVEGDARVLYGLAAVAGAANYMTYEPIECTCTHLLVRVREVSVQDGVLVLVEGDAGVVQVAAVAMAAARAAAGRGG